MRVVQGVGLSESVNMSHPEKGILSRFSLRTSTVSLFRDDRRTEKQAHHGTTGPKNAERCFQEGLVFPLLRVSVGEAARKKTRGKATSA
jgi:hypothetical protein